MPARCWVSVVDDGPAFGPTLGQGFCLLMPALPGGCGQRTDFLLLGRRPTRWPSSGAALGRGLSFAGDLLSIFSNVGARRTRDVELILVWRWSSVVDGGPTLSQRWFGVACQLGSSCIAHNINFLIKTVAAAGHCAGVVLMLYL